MGTAGWVRGGRFDRSRVRWEPLLDGLERLGLVGTSWGDCWGDSIASFGFFFGGGGGGEESGGEGLAGWLVGDSGVERDDGLPMLYKKRRQTERDRNSASQDESIRCLRSPNRLGPVTQAAATRGAARHPALTASQDATACVNK